MKPKNLFPFLGLILFFWAGTGPARGESKPVMVYYMPWFVAKPYGSGWGWHWTMDHFDPEQVNAAGQRQIASWYFPLIGPYDSSDPAVLEYHVLLMKLAGIDGVIVDWYGTADFLDYNINSQATAKLFDYTRKAGLKFSICYEDQTVRHMIDGNYLATNAAVVRAQEEMLHLQTNFFSDASYLRLKGRPVLLNFGPQYFVNSADWERIFSVLSPSNRPAFFTEDDRLPAATGAFSWPPMWLAQVPGTGGVLSGTALKNYLANFEHKAEPWPAYISSAFPRFHDIYQRAGVRNYMGYLGDRQGETLRETLGRALTNSSALVQIVTWNDFGEGTVVEPTEEYGYQNLAIVQELHHQYSRGNFPYGTNDLAVALQFYNLRKRFATNAVVGAQLDRVFTNIVSGDLKTARSELERLAK